MNGITQYRKHNLLAGWIVFLISAFVYIKSIEPTASFWDCGEYIACSYGLETGHPPGAPLFLLISRFFSLFSFGDMTRVAACVNTMSALASAFTILFLFWSITRLAKKILLKNENDYTTVNIRLVMAAGVVGALAYAFTDSFWFSAEEGEVYALSSLFTAVVFWAVLRWEEVADDPHADRWLIFIAYMIGLSIGVHLLSLLVIPSLVMVGYFRRTKRITWQGFLLALVAGVVLLGLVMDVIIPGVVKLAGKTELFFVNDLGMKFNSGTIIFFATLILGLAAGIYFTHRLRVAWLNTILLCFTVLLIGYSSFFVLIIRAQAGTPINENNPSNAISLLSYLNREQYGDWPLLYGQYYNTPLDPALPLVDGEPVYVRNNDSAKYIISDARKQSEYNYDDNGCTFFPRMYSSGHSSGYQEWGMVKGSPVIFRDTLGKAKDTINIPTMGENLTYFLSYQCGWMYARYFAWNFIGKQNDHTGYGSDAEGNWISGIPLLDDARQGDHHLMPDVLRKNKGRNAYFFIPFLLGLIGFMWHVLKSRRDTVVVSLLFLFTGLAIVVYLNQTPWQPRERDYSYVGSFYAFAIWIGLSVICIYKVVAMRLKQTLAFSLAFIVGLLAPLLLVTQNWDDHNRHGRTVARDVAVNFLKSCAPNAIIFTYADNDTFPLWFAQEVLGVRRDVRIVCLSLFSSDWYIDQMKKKQYDSDPLPISLTHWQYRQGTRDYIEIDELSKTAMNADSALAFMTSTDKDKTYRDNAGDIVNVMPARNLSLPVNKKLNATDFGIPSSRQNDITDSIYFRLRGNYVGKDQLALLDILAHNNWKRPIYFAVNMPESSYFGLDDYLQLDGMAYRLVPVKNNRRDPDLASRAQVNLDKAYNNVMTVFQWGGLSDTTVYADETVQRMFSDPVRLACSQIAVALAEAGRNEQAIDVVKRCIAKIPASQVAPDDYWIQMADAAFTAGDNALGAKVARIAFDHNYKMVQWYLSMEGHMPPGLNSYRAPLFSLVQLAMNHQQNQLAGEFAEKLLAIPTDRVAPDQYFTDIITAAFASGNNELGNKLAKTVFDYDMGKIKTYITMKYPPEDAQNIVEQLYAIYEAAVTFRQNNAAENYLKQMLSIGLEAPKMDDSLLRPDSLPDTLPAKK